MTLGQTTAVAMALVSAMAIGIWISPFVMEGSEMTPDVARAEVARVEPSTDRAAAAPVTIAAVAVTSPALKARLTSLLMKGADIDKAAEGFDSAEQFAAVVHAAHNTRIPFVLLKHRVLSEGQSLAEAIRASKPDIAADIEADRARAEARSLIAALQGGGA